MFPMCPTSLEGRVGSKKSHNTEDTAQTMNGPILFRFGLDGNRHVRFSQPEPQPRKTPSDPPCPSLPRGRPTNQMHGNRKGSRAPSPYPGVRERAFTREGEGMTSIVRNRSVSPTTEEQSLRRVSFPPPSDLLCKTASPPPPGSPHLDLPSNQKQSKSKDDRTTPSSTTSCNRSRAPSPYPRSRLPLPTRQVSFPDPEELPHRTLPPLRATNQKQSKTNGSSTSSSSSSSSRSRAPSPHPLSRAHRKQILQQLEASRTGHRDGPYQRQINDKNDMALALVSAKTNVYLNDFHRAATTDRAVLPFMNPRPSGWPSDTREAAAASTGDDDQAEAPKKQKQQQSFQEYWDEFEGFNEHRRHSDGEIRTEYQANVTKAPEPTPQKQQPGQEQTPKQDIGQFWDAFEDFNIVQIPKGYYDAEEAESTESRRGGGWLSRWFGRGH
ncbi:hypothetical protein PG993_003090 [Apiospora rasikravindrae]|uniref:Uncharacterized protein n=1 Tax=Apiospora rasikravindrae TaxID=990691 RepID=A0ABR1TYE9_9PEZI